MDGIADRQLVFRLDEIGFVLDLASVVEIREQLADDLDLSRSDLPLGIIGALHFRQTRIPVVDPTIRLDVISTVPFKEKVVLVLNSSEGNWGLLVDQIGGISSGEKFRDCEFPPLLKEALSKYYQKVLLLDQELFIVFEPQHYYGSLGEIV